MKGYRKNHTPWHTLLITGATLSLLTPCIAATTANKKPSSPAIKSTHKKKSGRLSLEFSDILVRQLLEILSQFSGKNFVLNDNVKGEMSIHLKNVRWQDALQVILESQGLGKLVVGNTYIIAPIQQITAKKLSQIENKNKLASEAPLLNKIIFLKFADATDIAKMLSSGSPSLLSPRGEVRANQRTNSVWLHDTATSIAALSKQIAKLDYPLKQVEIDARIVSINREYERNLGARLGVTKPTTLSGTLNGANEIQSVIGSYPAKQISSNLVSVPTTTITNSSGTTQQIIPYTDRLNFNNPALSNLFSGGSTFTPGGIGLALAKLGGGYLLDLELSALEGEQKAEILSSPKIITSNQHAATITQGTEIPYAVSSASGGTSIELKKAVLSLTVTPQITPDNEVILSLKVTNNSQGNQVTTGGTNDAITLAEEEQTSTVVLNNNQTVVVGGIYKETKSNQVVRIPLLGQIPIIGKLFSQTNKKKYHTELLIFLTPHVIKNPSKLGSGELGHEIH